MLISHHYRFLFVHIAKTGGTSVRAALKRYRWMDRYAPAIVLINLLDQVTRPRHRLGCKFPRHAKAIAAREMLPTEIYESLFKFVFVRNPWDLQVSSFHHIRREKPASLQGVTTFADFVKLKFDPCRPYDYMLDVSQERQHEYITDLQGRVIVDFIGRYERLQADFDRICDRLGLPRRPLPHHRRATDRDDYRRYYSDEIAELVAEHYRRDIELFGYSFDANSTSAGNESSTAASRA